MPDCYVVWDAVEGEADERDKCAKLADCAARTNPPGRVIICKADTPHRDAWARVRYDDKQVAKEQCETLRTCAGAKSCEVVEDGNGRP